MEVPGLPMPPRDPRDFLKLRNRNLLFRKQESGPSWSSREMSGHQKGMQGSITHCGTPSSSLSIMWSVLDTRVLLQSYWFKFFPPQDPWDGRTSLIACIFHPKLHRPVTWFLMQQCRDVEWWWVIRFNGLRPLPCVSSWQKSTSAKKIKLE